MLENKCLKIKMLKNIMFFHIHLPYRKKIHYLLCKPSLRKYFEPNIAKKSLGLNPF